MSKAIGIDLGTINSCVAVVKNGNVEVIANSQGHRVTPSIVAFTSEKRLVGDAAKYQTGQNPENTVYAAKRLIGRQFANIPQDDIKRWPFKVINQDGSPNIEVSFRNKREVFSPEQISAAVLSKMKQTAEEYLNDVVTDAVITVPAYFNDSQRQATKDAAEIAGLNVLRLINEPTAASIAYGLKAKVFSDQNILVFDMGGGTFDVSILAIDGETYEVKAVGGDTHLGGEDFNNKMLDHFLKEIQKNHKIDLSNDKHAISELLRECELAKISLSSASVADVIVKSLKSGFDFKSSMTRARFEDLNADFFKNAIKIVEDTIVQAKLTKAEIHEVVLVGGSTYIPKVQQMLQECFKGKTLNRSIKPDEAVAYGAAAFASTLNGDMTGNFDLLLLDVIPYSLGIEHGGGLFHKIIDRNSSLPIEVVSERFSTARDNQTVVPIKIYEGDHRLAIKNNLLGRFHLTGLTKAKARELRITVKFMIDEEGILEVTASESGGSVEKSLKVDMFRNGAVPSREKQVSDAELGKIMARIRLFGFTKNMGDVAEQQYPDYQFKSGLENYSARKYDEAYENFTKALYLNPNLIEAMEKRAMIHFNRNEFEECLIECEEFLKKKHSPVIIELKKNAERRMSADEPWYQVLKVTRNAAEERVKEAFKELAKKFHPNRSKNARLSIVDKKKIDAKMAKINRAKSEFDDKKF